MTSVTRIIPKKIKIADFRHKVMVCRQQDVITQIDGMKVAREGVWCGWAAVQDKFASTFSPHGASMNEEKDRRTHIIQMRYRYDLNISVMAWIYEQRLKSSPRWFKILKTTQTEVYGTEVFEFDCRIVQRGDDLAKPSEGPAVKMPDGVRL